MFWNKRHRESRGTSSPRLLLPGGTKAPPRVYRRLLYLNPEDVLNFLSVIQDGEVLERFQTSVSESNGDLGGEIKVGAGPVGGAIRGGRKRAHRLEQKVRITATVHSAIAEVIQVLTKMEKEQSDAYHLAVVRQPQGNELRALQGQLVELPLDLLLDMQPPDPTPRPDQRMWLLRKLTGERPVPGQSFVANVQSCADPAWDTVMFGHGDHLRVPSREFRAVRHATVLGQVDVVDDDEDLDAVDAKDAGWMVNIVARKLEKGVAGSGGGNVMEQHWQPSPRARMVIHPVCIYK